jgi:hypothetical protein
MRMENGGLGTRGQARPLRFVIVSRKGWGTVVTSGDSGGATNVCSTGGGGRTDICRFDTSISSGDSRIIVGSGRYRVIRLRRTDIGTTNWPTSYNRSVIAVSTIRVAFLFGSYTHTDADSDSDDD